MTEVYMPIAPQVEQGVITIKIQTITQINRQNLEIELEILVSPGFSFKNRKAKLMYIA